MCRSSLTLDHCSVTGFLAPPRVYGGARNPVTQKARNPGNPTEFGNGYWSFIASKKDVTVCHDRFMSLV